MRGSIIKRCSICGNRAKPSCSHKEAQYAIVYLVGKKQRWETVGRSRHDAEKRLTEALSEIHSGTYRPPKPILFSEFAEKWLRDYAALKVRPSTLETYRYLISGRFNPVFGKVPLTHLTSETIESFLASMEREMGLSKKSINNSLILLKTMLTSAKRWQYLKESPVDGIKRLTLEQKEMSFLTPLEIQTLLQYSDEPYRTLFLTAVLTGMRQGELLALQWGDIDFIQNQIYVRRSVYWRERKAVEAGQPTWMFVPPKTKYGRRTIVMTPKLTEALEIQKIACPVSPYDLVFCTPNGSPLEPTTVVYSHFHPALARAGVKRVRFHDLRHTFATLLISQGENVKFIQSQLGHASATMTLDRYGHLLPNTHRGAGERLDRQVFDPIPANVVLMEPAQSGQNGDNREQGEVAVTSHDDKR